jgi:hypothetical protein
MYMSRFDDYKDAFKTIKLDRDENGILQFTMHNNGGPYVFNEVAKDIHKGGHGELGEAIHEVAQDWPPKMLLSRILVTFPMDWSRVTALQSFFLISWAASVDRIFI